MNNKTSDRSHIETKIRDYYAYLKLMNASLEGEHLAGWLHDIGYYEFTQKTT